MRAPYDRDTDDHCSGLLSCILRVSIAISHPVSEFRVFSVSIQVTDLDDSPPYFSNELITVLHRKLLESVLPGRRLSLTPATDRDAPMNSRHAYSLTTPTAWFRLDYSPHGGGGGGALLDVVLLRTLDRESRDSYTLDVRCEDLAGNAAVLRVIIEVIDVNDHAPSFDRHAYKVEVPEDLEVNIEAVSIVTGRYITTLQY